MGSTLRRHTPPRLLKIETIIDARIGGPHLLQLVAIPRALPLGPLPADRPHSRSPHLEPLISNPLYTKLHEHVLEERPHHVAANDKHEDRDRWQGHDPEERVAVLIDGIETDEIHTKVSADKGQGREEDGDESEDHHEVVRVGSNGVEDQL